MLERERERELDNMTKNDVTVSKFDFQTNFLVIFHVEYLSHRPVDIQDVEHNIFKP